MIKLPIKILENIWYDPNDDSIIIDTYPPIHHQEIYNQKIL
jgi:hypothetical protein